MSDLKTMTVMEIAGILRISRTHAYKLVKEGVIPSIRVGRAIRVYKKSFFEWLEKNGGQGDIINLSEPQERRKKWQGGIQEILSRKATSGM